MSVDATTDMDDVMRELASEVTHVHRWLAEKAGINHSDLMCLYFVRTADGTATPKAVSERLGLTSGATTIMLNRLEAGRFIERSPHPTDRRGVLLSLGPATKEAGLANVRDYFRDMNRDVIASYSAEELAIVRRFMVDMMRNTRDKLRGARLENGAPVIAPPAAGEPGAD